MVQGGIQVCLHARGCRYGPGTIERYEIHVENRSFDRITRYSVLESIKTHWNGEQYTAVFFKSRPTINLDPFRQLYFSATRIKADHADVSSQAGIRRMMR